MYKSISFAAIVLLVSCSSSDEQAQGTTNIADALAGLNLPSSPYNYSNQTIPGYITKDNTPIGQSIDDNVATLGRVLFYDTNLSVNNSVSCASCHQPSLAFSDEDVQSSGLSGGLTGRHAMRLINVRFSN
jgi:cytochrome c peroxidase